MKLGQQAPDWSARLLTGGAFDLAAHRGKPIIVLTYLAANCFGKPPDPACRSVPLFEQAYRALKGRALFVWVNLWEDTASTSQAAQLAKRFRVTFPIVTDDRRSVQSIWGLQVWPSYIALDAEGRFIEYRIKPQDVAGLTAMITDASG
jgi:peroxiredoxin